MQIVGDILFFLLGAAIGSFLNVVILRLPSQQSLRGRSHCPSCQKQLKAWQLLPILSFWLLGGRCRYCRQAIAWRYLVIELVTALLFVLVWKILRPENFVAYLLFVQVLALTAFSLAVFVIDLEHFLILDSLTYLALVFFLALNFLRDGQTSAGQPHLFLNGLIGLTAGALPFFLIWFFSRGRLMGLGDVKLMLPLGAALGWPETLAAIFLAVFFGSAVGLTLVFFGRKTLKSPLPFGCFLVVAGLLAKIYGAQMVHWYLSFLGL